MSATKVGKKVGVGVLFDTVTIEIICGDDYLAQVLYDDLIDRLKAGEGITLSLDQDASGAERETLRKE